MPALQNLIEVAFCVMIFVIGFVAGAGFIAYRVGKACGVRWKPWTRAEIIPLRALNMNHRGRL